MLNKLTIHTPLNEYEMPTGPALRLGPPQFVRVVRKSGKPFGIDGDVFRVRVKNGAYAASAYLTREGLEDLVESIQEMLEA